MFWQLVFSALIASASAHVALWDKGMFGYNYPAQATDAQNYNNDAPVKPLRQDAMLTQDQWFGHGFRAYPPKSGDFLVLPAGGTYVADLNCNRVGSRMRDPSLTGPLPTYACDGEGALHTVNRFNATVDPKWFGGTALAIAYTSDVNALQPNDLTVISVNYQSPWFRSTSYPIPAGLPPCPAGGCICSWNWIHQQGHGEGYGPEIYNLLYRCQVTGSTDSTKTLPKPSIPVDCTGNPSKCMKGPKTPMYLWQASGNNLPDLPTSPNYNGNWGYMDGAQTDIFATPTSPAYTTPTATALPTGWTSLGCYKDQDPRTLPNFLWSRTNNTIQSCVAGCQTAGNSYAGVEGNECWCASSSPVLIAASATDCKKPCPGDTWATCGGDYRLNVYKAPTAPSAYTATTSTTPKPVPTPVSSAPAGWSLVGCVTDDPNTRTLNLGATASDNMTISACLAIAQAKGAAYFGVEYGRECWTGTVQVKANIKLGTGCNVACGGDPKTICGGPYLMTLFANNALVGGAAVSSSSSVRASSTVVTAAAVRLSTTSATPTTSPKPSTTTITTTTAAASSKIATPSSSTVPLPSGWRDLGCVVDSSSPRSLTGFYANIGKTNSAKTCIALCASKGFKYAGTEYSTECFCGNTALITPATGCTAKCPDGSGTCGGNYRINLYTNSTTTPAKRHLHRRRSRFADRGDGLMGVH